MHKFLLGMALSFTALASHGVCADKPAPHVDWNGCDKHGVNLAGANLQGANLYRATWTDGKKVCGPDSIGVCR